MVSRAAALINDGSIFSNLLTPLDTRFNPINLLALCIHFKIKFTLRQNSMGFAEGAAVTSKYGMLHVRVRS